MDKFEKQTMFSLEDVEHIIEHILRMRLPDALKRVRETEKFHADLRKMVKPDGTPRHEEPCWDCRMMIPELLNMNKGDMTVGTVSTQREIDDWNGYLNTIWK